MSINQACHLEDSSLFLEHTHQFCRHENVLILHRCACDVPAHGYTYSWEGNPNWSRAYVGAVELYEYFKGRAEAYGVYDYVKLEHAVRSAEWDDVSGEWVVKVEDLKSKTTFEDRATVLINAAGFLK